MQKTCTLFTVANFYKFVYIENYEDMRAPIISKMKEIGISGTILLGEEGINASIAGGYEQIQGFFHFLTSDDRFVDIQPKLSYSESQPFQKTKVKLRKEIVTLGIDDLPMHERGDYLNAEEWDKLIQTDDVFLIDTRNDYEVKVGTFNNAILPNIKTFRDFVDWTHDWIVKNNINKENVKIAQFCTGGIRCEKTTAYYKALGFKKVYHLEGGILKYLEDSKNANNLWQGDCFVFDDRVLIDDQLQPVQLFCKKCSVSVFPDDLTNVSKGHILCKECVHG